MSVQVPENIQPFDQHIDATLKAAERDYLNILGVIPYVGCISGRLRVLLGQIMIITSLALFALKLLQASFANEEKNREYLFSEASQIFSYTLHGIGNIVRGIIETIPFANTIVLLFYDHITHIRYNYDSEASPY